MYNRDMQLDALMVLIFVLATARATGLFTGTDEITRPYVRGTSNDDGDTVTPGLVGRINPDELERGWRHLLAYLPMVRVDMARPARVRTTRLVARGEPLRPGALPGARVQSGNRHAIEDGA